MKKYIDKNIRKIKNKLLKIENNFNLFLLCFELNICTKIYKNN